MFQLTGRRWESCAALLALNCVIACGAKTDGDAAGSGFSNVDPDKVQTREQFLDALVVVACEIVRCNNTLNISQEECVVATGKSLRATIGSTTANRSYEPAAGARCIEAASNASCVDYFTDDETVEVACADVFSGGKASGETCASDECQVGLFCDDTTCPGVCRVLPQQGETCVAECAIGLTCIDASTSSDLLRAGHCEARGAEGAECGDSVRDCDGGLVCDDAQSPPKCRPFDDVLKPVAIGEACREDFQCGFGSFCSGSLASASRVCTKLVTEGGACGAYDRCEWPLFCGGTAGERTCQAPKQIGEPCAEFGACQDGACIANVCQERADLGGACSEDLGCYSFSCEAGVCVAQPSCDPGPAAPATQGSATGTTVEPSTPPMTTATP